jgi:hydroxyethylthiazole kinase
MIMNAALHEKNMYETLAASLTPTLKKIRVSKPLILNITNSVTQDFVANGLLALGAAPLMTNCDEELEELITLSSAVVINIGTLDTVFLRLSYKAAALAKKMGKPLLLDLVGAGATAIRTDVSKKLVRFASIVRGNASEILALGGGVHSTLGVETTKKPIEALSAARFLAAMHPVTVTISGAIDIVVGVDQETTFAVGTPLMPLITGMGCLLTAVHAAFHAVEANAFWASVLATSYFGFCGEIAAQKAKGPAALKTAFIDTLYMPDFNYIYARIEESSFANHL